MRYTEFAIQEFRAAGWVNDKLEWADPWQGRLCRHVLAMLRLFEKERHSGTTAHYAVDLFRKLALFQPLTPLTGEDHEWVQVTDDLWQNKRCSRVFKDASGAYDSEGIVFIENGVGYVNAQSRVPITFPYMPVQQRQQVPTS